MRRRAHERRAAEQAAGTRGSDARATVRRSSTRSSIVCPNVTACRSSSAICKGAPTTRRRDTWDAQWGRSGAGSPGPRAVTRAINPPRPAPAAGGIAAELTTTLPSRASRCPAGLDDQGRKVPSDRRDDEGRGGPGVSYRDHRRSVEDDEHRQTEVDRRESSDGCRPGDRRRGPRREPRRRPGLLPSKPGCPGAIAAGSGPFPAVRPSR